MEIINFSSNRRSSDIFTEIKTFHISWKISHSRTHVSVMPMLRILADSLLSWAPLAFPESPFFQLEDTFKLLTMACQH